MGWRQSGYTTDGRGPISLIELLLPLGHLFRSKSAGCSVCPDSYILSPLEWTLTRLFPTVSFLLIVLCSYAFVWAFFFSPSQLSGDISFCPTWKLYTRKTNNKWNSLGFLCAFARTMYKCLWDTGGWCWAGPGSGELENLVPDSRPLRVSSFPFICRWLL